MIVRHRQAGIVGVWSRSTLGALLISASSASLATAQAQGESQGSFLEEIMVTAQRRAQSLQEVPSSITAFTENTINDYQITGVADFVALSPNIGFSSGGSPVELDLSFRGVSNLGGALNSVAVYVDEFNFTPAPNPTTFDPNLLDVARIEVLRGPQGTLFGRNVLGGGINITTNKPEQELAASADLEYGRFDYRLIRGIVNVPLTETLAVRALAFYEGDNGFITDIGPAGNTNDFDSFGGRLAARWIPNEDLTIDLAIAYSDYEQGALDAVPTGVPRPFFEVAGFPVDPFGEYAEVGFLPENTRTLSTNSPLFFDNETLVVTGGLRYDFEATALVVNAGYIENDVIDGGDRDFTAGDFFDDPGDISSLESFSLEARLQSTDDGPISWVVGGLYADDSRNTDLERRVLGLDFLGFVGLPPSFNDIEVVDQSDTIDIRSLALFGDVTWETPIERLTVSAGLRYSNDQIAESLTTRDVLDLNTGGSLPGNALSGEQTFDLITMRASALYEVNEDVNVYFNIGRGAKPGGTNLGLLNNPDPLLVQFETYDPEVLWNYEIGAKGRFFDGALVVNAAAFYSDWTDLQVLSGFFIDTITNFTNFTGNVGDAESYGFEVDFAAVLGDHISINGGVGYNNASVGNNILTTDDAGNLVDVSGNRLPFASRWTANFAAQYERDLTDALSGFIRGEFSYRSRFFEDLENTPNAVGLVDAYETVNIRVGVESENWRLVAYGENLTDGNHVIGSRNQNFVGLSGALATIVPTTWGVRFSIFTN